MVSWWLLGSLCAISPVACVLNFCVLRCPQVDTIQGKRTSYLHQLSVAAISPRTFDEVSGEIYHLSGRFSKGKLHKFLWQSGVIFERLSSIFRPEISVFKLQGSLTHWPSLTHSHTQREREDRETGVAWRGVYFQHQIDRIVTLECIFKHVFRMPLATTPS